jgi:hypothetical protein
VGSRALLLSTAAAALLLASGCSTIVGSCSGPLPHESAADLPPLKMPTGLEAPDTGKALEIPEVTEPELPRGEDSPCLDAPPAITAPPLPATPEYDNIDRQGRIRPPSESTSDSEAEEEADRPRRRRPPSRPR